MCDGGGSNPSGSPLFQQDLQSQANTLDLQIRIAHFPPYCSKLNPIEHRVLSHVSRARKGVVVESFPLVKQLIERTQTRSGLTVTVDILDRVYEIGRKAIEELKSSLRVAADALLPAWNYTVLPNSGAELGKLFRRRS